MVRKIVNIYSKEKWIYSILPCGTPEETKRKFEFSLFIIMLTHWLRLTR